MTYLLIHEDGTIEQTGIGDLFDLEENLPAVAAGILEIIRVQKYSTTFESVDADGTWVAI